MDKVKNIKGYWNSGRNHDFNETNSWEGQLILSEDGWFEGIVNDSHSPYKDDRFIFGTYLPEKGIELLKVTPSVVSDPFVFRGSNELDGYVGEFSVITLFGDQPYGQCLISVKESETQDIGEVQKRIDAWKEMMIGDRNSFLYENSVGNREQITFIHKKNWSGEAWTDEDRERVKEKMKPSEDEIYRQTTNELIAQLEYEMNHKFSEESRNQLTDIFMKSLKKQGLYLNNYEIQEFAMNLVEDDKILKETFEGMDNNDRFSPKAELGKMPKGKQGPTNTYGHTIDDFDLPF